MSKELTEKLLESIVDRKPSETSDFFAEAVLEKIKEKIAAHSEVVAENFFEVEDEDTEETDPEVEADDEEDSD